MISRCSFLAGVLVALAAICSANAAEIECSANVAEIEFMSPQLRQAALRHISDSSTSKATGRVVSYLEGYRDGVKAQLMKRDDKLLVDYGGDDTWGRAYEQGIVDVRWSKGAISFADLGYAEYFKGVGGFRFGFEESSFSPENTKERWWVEALANISFDGCAKCLVQGWITKPGEYGHLNQYQRTIMVTSVEPHGVQVETRARALPYNPVQEKAHWDRIDGSRNPADYLGYLEKFPSAPHAAFARWMVTEYGGVLPVPTPATGSSTSTRSVSQ